MDEVKKTKLFFIIGLFLLVLALFYLFFFLGAKSSCQGELLKQGGFWFCGEVVQVVDCIKLPVEFNLAVEQINFSIAK